MAKSKYPPISPGTIVKTTRPNWYFCDELTDEAWAKRKWGVRGTVITHHDSHLCDSHDDLCYDVLHRDGTVGCYDPSEFRIVNMNR